MCDYQKKKKKITSHTKRQKAQFKTTLLSGAHMDKVNSMQEHMGNVSREREILWKNKKKINKY